MNNIILLFTAPDNPFCFQAKRWLDLHQISYVEQDLSRGDLDVSVFRYILARSEYGTPDLFNTKTKAYERIRKKLDSITVPQLCEIIKNDPSIMRTPLLMSQKAVVIGSNLEEYSVFLPERRKGDIPGRP